MWPRVFPLTDIQSPGATRARPPASPLTLAGNQQHCEATERSIHEQDTYQPPPSSLQNGSISLNCECKSLSVLLPWHFSDLSRHRWFPPLQPFFKSQGLSVAPCLPPSSPSDVGWLHLLFISSWVLYCFHPIWWQKHPEIRSLHPGFLFPSRPLFFFTSFSIIL